ncbi:MAG: sulfatase [Myxococcota bacterium]
MGGAGRRPNVLLVCADDLNGWIGALGRHPGARTPHIDGLAAEGAHFTHAYCTAPHCNPSRMSVFTGLRPTTTGIYHAETLTTHAEVSPATLPEVMRASGYHTFGTGKVFHGHYDYATAARTLDTHARWLDTHNDPGLWDEFHAIEDEPLPPGRPLNGMDDPPADERELHWYSHFDWGAWPSPDDATLPDERVCARAEAFLERGHERPFLCAVGFYRPHLPWYVPAAYFDAHPLEAVRLPPVREDDLEDVPEIARRWALEPPDHPRILRHDQWRHAVRGYLAASTFCDALVGRLLGALERSGRDRDTLVVVFGDNGFHLGEKLHWRKFTLWEEATRVPLVMRWPGSGGARRFDRPVSLLDLFPTLVELCGLDAPPGLEGESLAAGLLGTGAPARGAALSTWGAGNHSVRTDRWRYTRYADGSDELYDHAVDPYEWTNLAGRSASVERVRELAPHLDALERDEAGRAKAAAG